MAGAVPGGRDERGGLVARGARLEQVQRSGSRAAVARGEPRAQRRGADAPRRGLAAPRATLAARRAAPRRSPRRTPAALSGPGYAAAATPLRSATRATMSCMMRSSSKSFGV